MNTPLRLSLYGIGLVAAFGAAFALSGALTPEAAVADRAAATEAAHGTATEHGETATAVTATTESTRGVTLASNGLQLSPVAAPHAIGEDGKLSFSVTDASGEPVLEYVEEHEKELHLIVVRSDGAEFRHVHPTLDTAGTWSLPWSWDAAGSYRVFADFVPAGSENPVTLTRTVEVAGEFAPADSHDTSREAKVSGFDVSLEGDLLVGSASTLTLSVSRDGKPVTTMEPYLGAFGHLVALREGDLAYLHVHPEGAEPTPGENSGPEVVFASEAPTAGRYFLYFDFQVDGKVYSAPFIVDAAPAAAGASEPVEEEAHDEGH
ncbi:MULTISPECIES: heavy-metal-associated domain-containing protein [unclassified Leucobacter]|uniref:heavy-metal-associated domain-containing protein n=1 Tax=unclassified Leucobacter TaxID=2621730 RepID=UPI00165D5482|nr:heavy-metal-associated domain-containing protein [Leucobacter sp. cx-87]